MRASKIAARMHWRYAHSHATTPAANVFDRTIKLTQRSRAAAHPDAVHYDYLRTLIAERLIDRLTDIKRRFPIVADIGCHSGHIASALPPDQNGIETVVQCDSSLAMIDRARQAQSHIDNGRRLYYVVCDEESLPLTPATYDLITTSLALHWVNDLPSLFTQIRQSLKPDGCVIGAMIGGSTLQELRSAFSLVDRERIDTLYSHLSPFIDGRSLGDLLSSAGLTLPTIDAETLTVRYPDLFTMMHHLQSMGENGAPALAGPGVPPSSFLAAAAAYESLYKDDEGLVPATLQIFYFIAWAPHQSQPKPLPRGSAKFKLTELAQLTKQKNASD